MISDSKQNMVELFCEKYNISKHSLTHDNSSYFRFLCFKYNLFLKEVPLPEIKLNSYYEAVFIEFRSFPHVEFIIRNAILKLGSIWSFTIICGNNNIEFMQNLLSSISPNINIIKVNIDNLNLDLYNKFLTSKDFWNLLHGEKILIYQEDSLIFHSNIKPFLSYDYVGAPFPKNQNDTPNCVGNGGLSLRSKSIMLKIINSISPSKTNFNSSTLHYMKLNNLNFPPEDIYFSKNAQDLGIGIVADYETSTNFSSESLFNSQSFGGHKFWISNPGWKDFMKKLFIHDTYNSKSDMELYLEFIHLDKLHNKTHQIKNAFDVDLYFCNKINKLDFKKKIEILRYIHVIGMEGIIYHPKQITNIFPSVKMYTFLNEIYILYRSHLYVASDFVSKFLYNNSYEKIYTFLIKRRYLHFNKDFSLLLLVFIGNEKKGFQLIDKIISYKKIQSFNIAFCFNLNYNIAESMKSYIKKNFEYYAVYESKEFGTDITPTLLMYDDIIKDFSFPHVIKLHSKTIENQFQELTDFLLNKPLKQLLLFRSPLCNCIGPKSYYIKLKEDIFNNELKIRFLDTLKVHFEFVGGTIFYCNGDVMKKCLDFVKTNYKSYLYNNLYENNSINLNNSPIHFLERLFGVVKF